MNVEDQEITDKCLIHIWMKQQTRKTRKKWMLKTKNRLKSNQANNQQPDIGRSSDRRSIGTRNVLKRKDTGGVTVWSLNFELMNGTCEVRSHTRESRILWRQCIGFLEVGFRVDSYFTNEIHYVSKKYLLYLFILLLKFHSLSFLAYFHIKNNNTRIRENRIYSAN